MCDLTYRQNGDYLVPSLMNGISTTSPIGKYGRMRRDFLISHRSILNNDLVLTEKLYGCFRKIDATAETRMNTIIPNLAESTNITETLNAQNPME